MSKTTCPAVRRIRQSSAIIGMSLILCVISLPLSAQKVSQEQAYEKAMAFLSKNDNISAQRKAPRQTPALQLAGNGDQIFVFNDVANGGYVIVSGDERMPEILGYSPGGHIAPGHIPCNLQVILDDCTRKVDELRANPKAGKIESIQAAQQTVVTPLLGATAWDQGNPYNKMCPTINGQNCLTGCVATATAQIMYYHKWPAKGQGSHSYQWNGQTLSADFSKSTYKWSKMMPTYQSNSSEESINAVALLMRDVGYSCDMNYGLAESGAAGQDKALITYFDYDASMGFLQKDYCDEATWNSIVIDELSHARPLFYTAGSSAGAHAMVIDGVDSNGYYHFNFGSSGDGDGYFSMKTVFFNLSPAINFGIKKDEGGSQRIIFCCSSDFEYGGYYMGCPNLTTNSVFPCDTYYTALAVENTANHNIQYMDEGEQKKYFRVTQQLSDGDYILYPVARVNSNEEWQKFLFHDYRQTYVDLNVKNGHYTYTNNKPDFTQEGAVEVDGIYYFLDADNGTACVTYKNDRFDYYRKDNVTIPETIKYKKKTYKVTEIGENAFCSARMDYLKIPKTITTFQNSSCSYSEIRHIVFASNSGLKSLMSFTFNYAKILSMGLDLPEGLEEIYLGAFQGADFSWISLPSSLRSFYGLIFNSSTKLRSVMVNWDTPLQLSSSPFIGFDMSLCTLYVPKGTAEKYRRANVWKDFGHIVEKVDTLTADGLKYVLSDGSATVLAMSDQKQHVVTIPRTVSHDGKTYTVKGTAPFAFGNSELEDLTIPSSVTSIGEGAFNAYYAISLSSLRFKGKTPPKVPDTTEQGKEGFYPLVYDGLYYFTTLYVPTGCKSKYEADSFWGKFYNIVEDPSLDEAGIPGDANNDGFVNMSDVTAIINYMLNKTPEDFVVENADINGDNFINMSDVTAIINIILGK